MVASPRAAPAGGAAAARQRRHTARTVTAASSRPVRSKMDRSRSSGSASKPAADATRASARAGGGRSGVPGAAGGHVDRRDGAVEGDMRCAAQWTRGTAAPRPCRADARGLPAPANPSLYGERAAPPAAHHRPCGGRGGRAGGGRRGVDARAARVGQAAGHRGQRIEPRGGRARWAVAAGERERRGGGAAREGRRSDARRRGARRGRAPSGRLRAADRHPGSREGCGRAAGGARRPGPLILRPALFPQDADAAADALAAGAPRGDRFLAMVDRLRVQG